MEVEENRRCAQLSTPVWRIPVRLCENTRNLFCVRSRESPLDVLATTAYAARIRAIYDLAMATPGYNHHHRIGNAVCVVSLLDGSHHRVDAMPGLRGMRCGCCMGTLYTQTLFNPTLLSNDKRPGDCTTFRLTYDRCQTCMANKLRLCPNTFMLEGDCQRRMIELSHACWVLQQLGLLGELTRLIASLLLHNELLCRDWRQSRDHQRHLI